MQMSSWPHVHTAEPSHLKTDSNAHTASKYDFVKVKVWLGDNASHYYILSRFLISRMLTVTKIPYIHAVRVALELKKYLVDKGKFEVSQANLEEILFKVMQSRGFGADSITRYKMVNKFHQERRPLIVVICGAPCTGKSSLAQQLASRFNMPNVLQTDLFHELLRTAEDIPMHRQPLWQRLDLHDDQLLAEYERECQIVRRSIDGDLVKTIRDGKSIIIEGLHLDPGLYLEEFGKYGIRHLHSADSLLPNQARSATPKGDLALLEPINQEPGNMDKSIQEAAGLGPGQALPQDSRQQSYQEPQQGDQGKQASSDLISSTRQILHARLSQETFPGSRLLFALASVADKLSPVLSSQVSSLSHVRQQNNDTEPICDTQTGQRPASDWFTQQLHKAYHGLADKCQPTGAAQIPYLPEEQRGSAVLEQVAAEQAAADQGQAQQAPCQQQPCNNNRQTDWRIHGQQSAHQQPRHQQPAHYPSEPQQHQYQQPGHETNRDKQAGQRGQHQQPALEQGQRQPAAHEGIQGATLHGTSAGAEAHDSGDVLCRAPTAVALGSDHRQSEASDHEATHVRHLDKQEDFKRELGTPKVEEKQDKHQSAATPVFVPIVVAMNDQNHRVLVDEWYSRQMAVSGQMGNADISDQEITATADATYRRLRLLQGHLCSYAKCNVPVVTLDVANFSDTIEQLHDYLLQCIESAMSQQ